MHRMLQRFAWKWVFRLFATGEISKMPLCSLWCGCSLMHEFLSSMCVWRIYACLLFFNSRVFIWDVQMFLLLDVCTARHEASWTGFQPGRVMLSPRWHSSMISYSYVFPSSHTQCFFRRSHEGSAVASVRGACIGAALRGPVAGRPLGQRGEDFGGLGGLRRSDLCFCRRFRGAALLATGTIMIFIHTYIYRPNLQYLGCSIWF